MNAFASIGLAVSLAISLSTAANAVPVLPPGSTTVDPLGINDLVVDGTTYDVTFNTTTLNSFSPGSTLSTDAASALAAGLNELSVTGLGNFPPTGSGGYLLDVDDSLTLISGAECDFIFCAHAENWTETAFTAVGIGLGNNILFGTDEYVEAADFSPVSTLTGVPEPFTLGVFGAGLCALFLLRRRSKSRIT